MHIAFDAKRLFQNNTGLGNYSRSLVKGLQEFYPEHRYTLFAPKIVVDEKTSNFLTPNFQHITPKNQPAAYWRSVGCAADIRKNSVDIFHGLSHELPFGIKKSAAKSILTVHDLIFKRYPEQYSIWDRYMHDFKCRYACENADKIIAISKSTKQDIMTFYGVKEQKIEVVYQSCSFIGVNLGKIENTPLILYVGSIIERKNLFNLVKAMELLPKSLDQAVLYIVGGGKNAYRTQIEQYIAAKKLGSRIVFLQNVSDEDLAAWYQRASVFVYPSVYEGFGIPVIEALFSGTPVITSTQLALTEAAGEDSLCIDVSKPEVIADAISIVLNNKDLAEKMSEKGLLYAQRFLPERVTNELMAVYQNCI
ncbi:MAG: hypothetical protein RI894_238 [Bacteroidota bacterium]|jgi:glycosyltransferase involved in cell wall biosynthesis